MQFRLSDKVTCMYRVHLTNITRTSGAQRRQRDLVYGRMKVLDAEWFPELSLATRRKFLYSLLIDLLADHVRQQQVIFNHPNFEGCQRHTRQPAATSGHI